jgi:hypothetical protein
MKSTTISPTTSPETVTSRKTSIQLKGFDLFFDKHASYFSIGDSQARLIFLNTDTLTHQPRQILGKRTFVPNNLIMLVFQNCISSPNLVDSSIHNSLLINSVPTQAERGNTICFQLISAFLGDLSKCRIHDVQRWNLIVKRNGEVNLYVLCKQYTVHSQLNIITLARRNVDNWRRLFREFLEISIKFNNAPWRRTVSLLSTSFITTRLCTHNHLTRIPESNNIKQREFRKWKYTSSIAVLTFLALVIDPTSSPPTH